MRRLSSAIFSVLLELPSVRHTLSRQIIALPSNTELSALLPVIKARLFHRFAMLETPKGHACCG